MTNSKIINRLRILVAEKEVRDRRQYSLRDIASQTGLSINTVAGYLRGDTTNFYGNVLIAFCDWLDCQPGDILVLEDDATPKKQTALTTGLLELTA